jgi:hypothetical protein
LSTCNYNKLKDKKDIVHFPGGREGQRKGGKGRGGKRERERERERAPGKGLQHRLNIKLSYS